MKSEVSQTSSVGACWPPVSSTHQRIRGFYPEIIGEGSEHEVFAETLQDVVDNFKADEENTRLSIRTVVTDEYLGAFSRQHDTPEIEAAMPLFIQDESPLHIVYFGYNRGPREVPEDKLKEHSRTIWGATKKQRYTSDPTTDLADHGYYAEMFSPINSDEVFSDVCELYSKFGYDERQTAEILSNPDNLIVFAREQKTGRVVSTVMAEHAALELTGTSLDIRVCEFTEAITDPEMRQHGLYKKLSCFLLHCLEREGLDPIQAIYGESNLASVGVINSAHQTGRTFSHLDSRYWGVAQSGTGFGILKQNFKVLDGYETRDYNDFALSYYDLAEIRARSE